MNSRPRVFKSTLVEDLYRLVYPCGTVIVDSIKFDEQERKQWISKSKISLKDLLASNICIEIFWEDEGEEVKQSLCNCHITLLLQAGCKCGGK